MRRRSSSKKGVEGPPLESAAPDSSDQGPDDSMLCLIPSTSTSYRQTHRSPASPSSPLRHPSFPANGDESSLAATKRKFARFFEPNFVRPTKRLKSAKTSLPSHSR